MAGDNKVISIFDRQPVAGELEAEELVQHRERAAQALESIVAEFRGGHLTDFILIATASEGGTVTEFSEGVFYAPMEFVGALHRAIHKINTELDEIDDETNTE